MTATATTPLAKLPPHIAEFCERAVEALRDKLPVREVWLFGSHAEGKAKPDSDVDLFVVLADDHGLQRPNIECRSALEDIRPRPLDVTTLQESYWHHPRYRRFGMWGDIAAKGVCLFQQDGPAFPTPTNLPPMPGDPTYPESWFENARRDLADARLILHAQRVENALTLLQQSSEKVMKGWLIERQWPLVKTHALLDLVDEIEERGVTLNWFKQNAQTLTDAFFFSRNPSNVPVPSVAEAQAIVCNVERLFSELGVNL